MSDTRSGAAVKSTRAWAHPSVLIPGVVLFLIVGGLALAMVPGWLLGNWFPDSTNAERNKLLGVAGQIVLFALGGVIAIVGVGVSLSRHGQELMAAEREQARLDHDQATERARRDEAADARQRDIDRENARRAEVLEQRRIDAEIELRARFVGAVGMLSDDAPIHRQAGLFALAALADAWSNLERDDETQVCIDVITSYLCSPLSPGVRDTPAQERDVRLTGYALIRAHLTTLADPSWREKVVKLSGALIDYPVELSGLSFTGDGGLHLSNLVVRGAGHLTIGDVRLSAGAQISLLDSVVEEGGVIKVGGMVVEDGGCLVLYNTSIEPGGEVMVISLTVRTRGTAILAQLRMAPGARFEILHPEIQEGGIATVSEVAPDSRSILNLTSPRVRAGGEVRLHDVVLPQAAVDVFAERLDVASEATVTGTVSSN